MCCVVLRKQWTRVRGCRPSTNTPACLVQRVNVSVDLGICRDIGRLGLELDLIWHPLCQKWSSSRKLVCDWSKICWRGDDISLFLDMLSQRICWVSNPPIDPVLCSENARSAKLATLPTDPMAHTLGLGLGLAKVMQNCKFYTTTEFGTNRKLICDFLLVISNLAPILHRFWDIAFDRSKIAYPSCV